MDIKLVIFDWSGVISDDRKPVYEANSRMMREHDLEPVSFNEWVTSTTMTPREWFANRGIKKSSSEIFEWYRKRYTEVVNNGMHPTLYPDAANVLHNLKKGGKRIAVLSSHPTENIKSEAENYGVSNLLDLISGNSWKKQ